MSKIYIFFADGLEEIEGLTVVDLMRRADLDIQIINVTGEDYVTGSHGIVIGTDLTLTELVGDDPETAPLDGDMYVLPGGLPGTTRLGESAALGTILTRAFEAGKYIAAICAAPSVLGKLGITNGRRATSYPGWEKEMPGCDYLTDRVVIDGNLITSRGMGTAIEFGAALVSVFKGTETGQALMDGVMYLC